MNDSNREAINAIVQLQTQADYQPPVVRVMTEAEVLSAFQVTAAGSTAGWWAC